MKEKPILFSAPMVKAILDGRKSQTRRIVKAASKNLIYDLENATVDGPNQICAGQYLHVPFRRKDEADEGCRDREYCPYGDPSDRLWVKETWVDYCPHWFGAWCGCGSLEMRKEIHRPVYRADAPELWKRPINKEGELMSPTKWKPSIFMPRWASRLTLEITAVRVERLQDIPEADAKAEGVQIPHVNFPQAADSKFKMGDALGLYRDHYRVLWNNINGPESWDANPWVWVLEFKRIES